MTDAKLPVTPVLPPEPQKDRRWHWPLMWVVRFRAWLLGGVFTAGAQAVIFREGGDLLLVRPRYRAGWGLVGGFMKPKEQSMEAMIREMREEVGIEITVDRPHAVYKQERRRHIEHLFVIEVPAHQPASPSARFEIAEARWFAPTDLPPLQSEAHAALRVLEQVPEDQRL